MYDTSSGAIRTTGPYSSCNAWTYSVLSALISFHFSTNEVNREMVGPGSFRSGELRRRSSRTTDRATAVMAKYTGDRRSMMNDAKVFF